MSDFTLFKAVVLFCLLGILVGALSLMTYGLLGYPLDDNAVNHFYEWMMAYGYWAPVVFVLIHMLVVITMMPAFVFPFGAGFMFGTLAGSAYTLLSTIAGAWIAYWLGRSPWALRLKQRWKSMSWFQEIETMADHLDWRHITCLRLIPVFPFKMSNYVLGMLQVKPAAFSIGTTLGLIPITLLTCNLGAMSNAIVADPTYQRLSWEWYAALSLLGVMGIWLLHRMAHSTLQLAKVTD